MEGHLWKILLVEDDEDDYILTRSLLEEARGKAVHFIWVTDYKAALEAIDRESLDVILVDYRLGSANGLDLVREAVARNCKVPIIMMTGQGSYDVDLEAMKVGATDYLSKGEVTPGLLERTIRYAIERKQAQEALQRANDELETRVEARTQELARANEDLRAQIAERMRAEIAVRESEERFRKLAETTSTAIFIIQEMKIRYANSAARTITGFSPAELLGKDFWEIAHPSYRTALQRHGLANQWGNDLSGDIPARYELKLLTKDGKERWVDITAGSFEYQGAPALVITAFDITERDLAEQALRKAKSELEARVTERTRELKVANERLAETNKLLSKANARLQSELEERKRVSEEVIRSTAQIEVQHRLIQYREMERLLIAQELHDGTLQEMIAMSFTLNDAAAMTRSMLDENIIANAGELRGKLERLQTMLNEQISQVRAFCSELRPPSLAPYGLEKAIESHAESFQEKHPAIRLHQELMHDGQQLTEGTRLALFRIYQELLNNVVRHAKASDIWVRFKIQGEMAELQVQDNGQGFVVPSNWVEIARQGHLGLVGVQERAEAVGGQVNILSSPGEGTLVKVNVPLSGNGVQGFASMGAGEAGGG